MNPEIIGLKVYGRGRVSGRFLKQRKTKIDDLGIDWIA